MKKIRSRFIPFLYAFIYTFILGYIFLALFSIVIYIISGHIIHILSILSFASIFGASLGTAFGYVRISVKIPIKNREYLLIDLQSILYENGWKIKKISESRLVLENPFYDRLPFPRLEIDFFDDYIQLNGFKRLVNKLLPPLRILS